MQGKFYYTYVLLSEKDNKLYTGSTKKLKERFELIFYEACLSEDDARRREKSLKSHRGRMIIKNRLKSYFTG
jgi:putative endonuclease